MFNPQNHRISVLSGMFLDKPLEQEFQKSYLNRSRNHLRKCALIIGAIFFWFFICDYILNGVFISVVIIFLCRLSFLVLSFLFFFKPDYFLKFLPFLKITIYELIAVILFIIIILNYENPNFMIQAFAINIIILCIFILVPNLLCNKVFLSIFTLIGFLVIALTKYHPPVIEIISVLVYLSLAIFFCSISSFRLGHYKRLDFANKQYLIDLSTKDPLTKIYNRLKFNESLSSEIELAKRYGNPFSIIMFDIDHFKQFNDEYGHSYGDKILIEISNLVKELVREVDVFARWGGEEFVILLPHTHCKEASALAQRLEESINKESLIKGKNLTCSFGVTSFSWHDDQELIMDRVDRAMYRAKESGRNVVVTEWILPGWPKVIEKRV